MARATRALRLLRQLQARAAGPPATAGAPLRLLAPHLPRPLQAFPEAPPPRPVSPLQPAAVMAMAAPAVCRDSRKTLHDWCTHLDSKLFARRPLLTALRRPCEGSCEASDGCWCLVPRPAP